jgi:glycosyltransferase involved in cell wall biosynthesis
LAHEFEPVSDRMHVVAVSDAEARRVRAHHRGGVSVLGHALPARPTARPFQERAGLLFVGAIHDRHHPNFDGLAWFVDEVLPLVERVLRWETRLTVAGYVAKSVAGEFAERFGGHGRLTLRGAVADLVPLYDAHRVFIAPARFAAGIPYKVHEAAAFGVPVVATTLLAEQLGWPDSGPLAAADPSDPAGFAERVIALHRDAHAWARVRATALDWVRTELDPDAFAARVGSLIQAER